MPLRTSADLGTEADGSSNAGYCAYCYKEGAFTRDCTMEEMIEFCAQFHEQFRYADGRSFTREEAVASMQAFFPTLARWKK